MKALIGHTLKEAKDVAKQELGVKRMGDARFQMILDKGVKNGVFKIVGDRITHSSVESFFDLDEPEVEVEDTPAPPQADPPQTKTPDPPQTKTPHPPQAQLDPKLSSSDLPRAGDLFHYRSYSGEVVQGEIISTVCFAECQNPDGTWQAVAFQDLHLKKRGVPKETMLNHLKAFYQNNDHLRSERDALLAQIVQLKAGLKSPPQS